MKKISDLILGWFGRARLAEARRVIRARTLDTNPVYSQRLIQQLPGAEANIGQVVNSTVEESTAAGLSTTGTTQSGATKITALSNEFTTVGSANGAAVLPNSANMAGQTILVVNAAATNSMVVFPFLGDKINGGSANAGFTVAAGKRCFFSCIAAGNWYTTLTA